MSHFFKYCVAIAFSSLLSASANAVTTTYTDSTTFLAQLGASITDDYSAAGYVFYQSDAEMSAVLNETQYTATGFSELNTVFNSPADPHYCAGCNGSFLLNFQSTSVGNASGVFGVGFDFANVGSNVPYYAFVTFGNGSTLDVALPITLNFPDNGYFGITSDLRIASIAFGLSGGGTTQLGSFAIDNLTIGAASPVDAIPLPAGLPLFASGLGALGLLGWRSRRKNATARAD